jgi:DNA-binding MarR family transcriptional regulator
MQASGPFTGRLMDELRRHDFEVSPGTLYPLLARMETQGWIRRARHGSGSVSPKARREFRITAKGAKALARLRRRLTSYIGRSFMKPTSEGSMVRRLMRSDAPASVVLIRLMVGAVFLSEGLQKFVFPDQLGAGRFLKS